MNTISKLHIKTAKDLIGRYESDSVINNSGHIYIPSELPPEAPISQATRRQLEFLHDLKRGQ